MAELQEGAEDEAPQRWDRDAIAWASTYTKKWGDQIRKLLVRKTCFF